MSAPDGDGVCAFDRKHESSLPTDVVPVVPSLLDKRHKAVASELPLDVDSDVLSILDPAGDLLEVLQKEVQHFDAQVSPSVLRTLAGSRLQCQFFLWVSDEEAY